MDPTMNVTDAADLAALQSYAGQVSAQPPGQSAAAAQLASAAPTYVNRGGPVAPPSPAGMQIGGFGFDGSTVAFHGQGSLLSVGIYAANPDGSSLSLVADSLHPYTTAGSNVATFSAPVVASGNVVMAGVVVIGVLAFSMDRGLRYLQHRWTRWAPRCSSTSQPPPLRSTRSARRWGSGPGDGC